MNCVLWGLAGAAIGACATFGALAWVGVRQVKKNAPRPFNSTTSLSEFRAARREHP